MVRSNTHNLPTSYPFSKMDLDLSTRPCKSPLVFSEFSFSSSSASDLFVVIDCTWFRFRESSYSLRFWATTPFPKLSSTDWVDLLSDDEDVECWELFESFFTKLNIDGELVEVLLKNFFDELWAVTKRWLSTEDGGSPVLDGFWGS